MVMIARQVLMPMVAIVSTWMQKVMCVVNLQNHVQLCHLGLTVLTLNIVIAKVSTRVGLYVRLHLTVVTGGMSLGLMSSGAALLI